MTKAFLKFFRNAFVFLPIVLPLQSFWAEGYRVRLKRVERRTKKVEKRTGVAQLVE